jgi:cation/acetate symporter
MPSLFEQGTRVTAAAPAAFKSRLNKVCAWFTVGFVAFVLVLAALEQMGLPKSWIGFIFLIAPVLLYAGIGILTRTNDAAQYYVAGRRVPAMYNGMATGADWMSAASFIGMTGTLYLSGYDGLAFVMGWTGGFCLLAIFLVPYLRKFGQYTIPDFLGARYEGNLPRFIGIIGALLCSFTYLVAQIYGVGLITTRLTGFAFEIGIFVGLGGMLVCSFLGGMRAVTWTQVAQCIVLVVAYMVAVVWLSVKQTGVPIPQAIYGYQLQKVTEREKQLATDPKELEVIEIFRQRAAAARAKLKDPARALIADETAARRRLETLVTANGPLLDIQATKRALAALPKTVDEAKAACAAAATESQARAQPLAGMPPHAQAFAGDAHGAAAARGAFETDRRNFLALTFCLMIGTAALPHILTRYYTTPTVKEARDSVTWSLVSIFVLYVTAPALALLVNYQIFNVLVGTPFEQLPAWIRNWTKVDPALLSVADINRDGIFQLAEMRISGDIIVLATPQIAGLPYVVSGMVAAGGLAAALSTADGLLLTISNALSHDLYYRTIDPTAPTSRRVAISKALLVVVALAAAGVAAQKPADILFLVSAAFSFAAASFFPVLVLGIFCKRANNWGASLGMVAGLGTTCYCMATTQPWLRGLFGVTSPVADHIWLGISPISAGLFGVPVGAAVIVIVSLLTPAPSRAAHELVEHLRYAGL